MHENKARDAKKAGRHPTFLFFMLLMIMLLMGCNLPATLTPEVGLVYPADGSYLPLAPYTLDAESIGAGFSHINFIVNGVTVDIEHVDPTAAGIMVHYTWNPPATGEYYIQVFATGPGGTPQYVGLHPAHICVTHSVTGTTPGFTGTGCDPMPPTTAFTSLNGSPSPVYYDAPAGSTTCPGDITVSAELNDIAYIVQVNVQFEFYAGTSTTPFANLQSELPFKAGRVYANDFVVQRMTSGHFSALHGGDGALSFYAFAYDMGSVRVATSRPVALQLRHCAAATPTLERRIGLISTSTPTLEPTIGLTSALTFTRTSRPTALLPTHTPVPPSPIPTHTLPPPPPLSCSDHTNVPDKCKLSGCYYWSDGTCSSSQQPIVPPACSSYGDQKSCEATGRCKWDGKSCY